MPTMIRNFSATLALLTLGASTLPAQAQSEADERWYQVELIIFANKDITSNEQWPPLPELAYPEDVRFLVYPEAVESRAETYGEEYDGESIVDELGRQIFSYKQEPELDVEESTDIPLANPPLPTETDTMAQETSEQEAIQEAEILRPTPFIALPHRSREFNGKSAYMQRSGSYQILFHETWVQPVRDKGTALPIAIDNSGDLALTEQQWPRLQGSVKLHIARYLHLETNLWLNTNGDYLPGQWRMPAPPLSPPSIILPEPEPEEELPYYVDQGQSDTDTNVLQPAEDNAEEVEEELTETAPIYPYRHAVLVQQNRRMRSNEVHYLDHPLLGVVIKFTPMDEERLEAMARAEQADVIDQAQ